MDRREMLAVLTAGTGMSSEMLALGRRLHDQARLGTQRPMVLDRHQRETITAAAERIIPRDNTPGATDAGVTSFIDHMLAEWYPAADRDRVLAGLVELDDRSHTLGSREFVRLAESDQTVLLETIDGETGSGAHWFATLKFLIAWGYCTSEIATRENLGTYPLPMRFDGCAPYRPGIGGR